MSTIRLILTLHNHQPVGNFDGVFAEAFRAGYLPFLEVMEDYPDIPFSLHISGPLLEWLLDREPDYIRRLRARVAAGKLEILGGAFQEPILTMIPHRDRVGQIREYTRLLAETFETPVRGLWPAERVWEPQLATALAEAGIEFTLLDDFHFKRAGLDGDDLLGYWLVEDEGRLVKVFPIEERLRYLVPFAEPHAAYEHLRRLAETSPDALVVFGDDGEKFGVWPETYDHVYTNGWLRRFCDMLSANRDWLRPTSFAEALDHSLPRGKIYLPESSYREMTEWVLPTHLQRRYREVVEKVEASPLAAEVAPFLRAGGFWRNFRAKYPESDEMYTRMLEVSDRLRALERSGDADPDYLDAARQELYRGQCNCPYWHGAFGGLYLPHLRNAIYASLVAADNALDDAEGLADSPRVSLDVADYNLDARQEVRLANDRLVAYVRPANGGHVYELDVRRTRTNLLATLDRRPEPYHEKVAAAARAAAAAAAAGAGAAPDPSESGEINNLHNKVILKQTGLDRLLIYDRHPRKALVDHVYPLDASLDDILAHRDVERGDFVSGAYLSRFAVSGSRASLVMERRGVADGHLVRVAKEIALEAGSDALAVRYSLENVPANAPFRFAVEINLAAMAGNAPDRYILDERGERLGTLDTPLSLDGAARLAFVDEWQDLAVGLAWTRPGGFWTHPIETVSQSEGGYEKVFQSVATHSHWVVEPDAAGHWSVELSWRIMTVAEVEAWLADPAAIRAGGARLDRDA